MNLASSNVATRSWSCLEVLLSALNPSWLSCKIWCFSPYADSMNVKVLVKRLYIIFDRAIGLWFESLDGSPFCIEVWLDLFSMMLEFVVIYSSERRK